mgnify:CR=1 FL=1
MEISTEIRTWEEEEAEVEEEAETAVAGAAVEVETGAVVETQNVETFQGGYQIRNRILRIPMQIKNVSRGDRTS